MIHARRLRKAEVFHIMYGWFEDASTAEMRMWRELAAQYVQGLRLDVPLTLEEFREHVRRRTHVAVLICDRLNIPYAYVIDMPLLWQDEGDQA